MDWAYLASNRASVGVLVMWDKRMVEKMKDFIGEYTM